MKSFAHHYSSDISREQFEPIRTDLEGIRKRTKPRKVDLYDIFCALLYTLKNGCVWRDLPSDFPKWETVYYYWLLWTKTPSPAGITPLDKVLKNCQPTSVGSEAFSLYIVHHSRCSKCQEYRSC